MNITLNSSRGGAYHILRMHFSSCVKLIVAEQIFNFALLTSADESSFQSSRNLDEDIIYQKLRQSSNWDCKFYVTSSGNFCYVKLTSDTDSEIRFWLYLRQDPVKVKLRWQEMGF